MGEVYEAEHVELRKRVALKTLHADFARGPEDRERFLREGRAAAQLRHPHVVEVFDAGEDGDTMYLVMELLEGEDLLTRLRRETRLDLLRIADVMLPVLAAVASVHERGIVHRDLKPSNIFLARGPYAEPLPKVLDFGISKLGGRNLALTQTGDLLGTPHYMSPEQARGLELDARSDQYSLGVILYQLATGRVPFTGTNLPAVLSSILNDPLAPMREQGADVPAGFESVVMRSLERDPALRFPSVFALGQALLAFADERSRVVWRPAFDLGARPVDSRQTQVSRSPFDPETVTPSAADATTRRERAVVLEDTLPPSAARASVLRISVSDREAAAKARERVRHSPRMVLLYLSQSNAPEAGAPLAQVLGSTRGQIDVVVFTEAGERGPWLHPMDVLCESYAPGRSDARQCYLLLEGGRLVMAMKKDRDPLADAEQITRFLSKRLQGVHPYRRGSRPG
jgi:serine/threonine-protein kinase